MKAALIFFLIGALAGGLSLYFYRRDPAPATTPAPGEPTLTQKARESAAEARESIAAKLESWRLTPDDIRRDLAETGRVVRSKARAAGEKVADARIVAVIKAKYVLERDLSALDINVDCRDGEVTLTGTVDSAERLGRAVVLALDTEGVHNVVSRLTLPP